MNLHNSWRDNLAESERILREIHAQFSSPAKAPKPTLYQVGRTLTQSEIRALYKSRVTNREAGLLHV